MRRYSQLKGLKRYRKRSCTRLRQQKKQGQKDKTTEKETTKDYRRKFQELGNTREGSERQLKGKQGKPPEPTRDNYVEKVTDIATTMSSHFES